MLKKIQIKTIVINIFVFICLIVVMETSFLVGRKVMGRETVGWMIAPKTIPFIQYLSNDCFRMKTHPFLSHVHDHRGKCSIKGGVAYGQFVHYGDPRSQYDKIITLGGSTTDGFFQQFADGETWPKRLSDKLKTNGLNFNVMNGGVGGYGSSQEAMLLFSKVLHLKPNIKFIISLNGINEIKSRYYRPYSGLPFDYYSQNPYFTDVLLKIYGSQLFIRQNEMKYDFLPNTQSFLRWVFPRQKVQGGNEALIAVDHADPKKLLPEDLWEHNVHVMREMAKSVGATYLVFLQPNMGINESQIPRNTDTPDGALFNNIPAGYLSNIQPFMRELSQRCEKIDFCFDLTRVAPPTGNMYSDYRHHNQMGNEIITEEIFKVLEQF